MPPSWTCYRDKHVERCAQCNYTNAYPSTIEGCPSCSGRLAADFAAERRKREADEKARKQAQEEAWRKDAGKERKARVKTRYTRKNQNGGDIFKYAAEVCPPNKRWGTMISALPRPGHQAEVTKRPCGDPMIPLKDVTNGALLERKGTIRRQKPA